MGEWVGDTWHPRYYYVNANDAIISKPISIGDPDEYFEGDFVVKWWHTETREDAISMYMDIKKNYPGVIDKNPTIIKSFKVTTSDIFQYEVSQAARRSIKWIT